MPAWIWMFTMIAFMAGPTMHIRHQVAYLQTFIMPYLLRCLFQATCLTDLVLCKTTYKLFSSIWVGSNLRHVHTFGCPVFALQNVLASGSQLPRWSPRSCLRLNLDPSPMHARNVYLVLNLVTECASPQYHCRFDDFFETTSHCT